MTYMTIEQFRQIYDEWKQSGLNIGTNISIDKTCLSTGEVYTIVSNKKAHGRKGCIIAIVKGTKAKEIMRHWSNTSS